MPDALNQYTSFMILLLCALLFVCGALLIALLIRLKRQERVVSRQLRQLSDEEAQNLRTLESRLRDEISRQQAAANAAASESARMMDQHLTALGSRLDTYGQSQETRLHRMSAMLDEKLMRLDQRTESLRASLAESMDKMQKDNAEKLEKMRLTVDEKLHETLNRRLGESFSLVNDRLEQVYKGLGEMQTLAAGVGDLKRVLTNVKTRGIWGEVQLGALLEQILAPSQYAENVSVVPHSRERVEFAIILPGHEENQPVFLPIDSKFPVATYERLLAAVDTNDPSQVNDATADLQAAIRNEAKRISSKYICPPYTTDFAIMFLPTEGLYAEALRCSGMIEEIQQKHRVMIAGPSTLAALLNSLQLGFRTLAIEQRSAEVWQLLGAVKTEFSRFSDLLDQTQQRLRQAGESIEQASVRTRAINRRLRDVEALNASQAASMLQDKSDRN